jgi:catechol 2,3-dioxygenase-like lactoylglutathione lyase family enzyme
VTERTIPILPCRSIDATLAFYEALGFGVTYRQERPNTYAVVQRRGIELQFFVLPGLDPAANYSSCYVLVSDVDALYAAFCDGARAAFGRLPSRGVPRIGALRDMSYGVRQFIVVDPAGNHIRIGQPIKVRPPATREAAGRLERALEAAITLADSKQDDATAARVLASAFGARGDTPPAVVLRARVLQADLAYRLGDRAAAIAHLAEARAVDLGSIDGDVVADELARANDLEAELAR